MCGLLLVGSGVVCAAEEEVPDIEFLEYLGMWEESDEDWRPKLRKEVIPHRRVRNRRRKMMKVKSTVAKAAIAVTALLLFGAALAQSDGVSWDSLSDGQREVLSQLEGSWDTLPAERQQRLVKGAERWAGMSRKDRRAARDRFRSWRELDAERREQIRERAQLFRNLSPEEQDRIRKNYRNYREMNRDRRQQLRERYKRMTPDQRQHLRDRLQRRPRPAGRD